MKYTTTKFVLVFLFFIITSFAVAQSSPNSAAKNNVTVRGYVYDEIENTPLAGAIILRDTISGAGVTADADGFFELNGLALNTEAYIQFEYVGYHPFIAYIKPTTLQYNLPDTIHLTSAMLMKEVTIWGSSPIAEVKGDTIQYNAGAYKTNPDATAADLISKMPGFEKNEDGSVNKEGEAVTKILVDGKNFFRDDAATALNSLPANIVKSIQFLDDKSDESKFSGYDDGTRVKTINIITTAAKKNAVIGEYYAGYGLDNKYMGAANTNIFTKKDIINIGFGANNINSYPLSQSGYYGGGGKAGLTEAAAFKLNYDREIKEGNLSLTYTFSHNDTDLDRFVERQYDGGNRFYDSKDMSNAETMTHRVYTHYEQRLNPNNKLILRPSFTFTDKTSFKSSSSSNMYLTSPELNNSLKSNTETTNVNYSIKPNVMWFHNFSKSQFLYTSFRGTFSNNDEDRFIDNEITNVVDDVDKITESEQFIRDLASSNNISANLGFTQGITDRSRLNIRYGLEYDWSDTDKRTYVWDELSQDYKDINDDLSNTFARDYLKNNVRLGYSYTEKDKHFVNMSVGYSHAELQNNMTYPTVLPTENYTFQSPEISAMYNWKITKTKNFFARLRTNANLPSMNLLQNVLDNSNPMSVSIGNPYLDQSYSSFLMMQYRSTNREKSTTFSAYTTVRNNQNSFATNRQVLLEDTEINGVLVQKGAELSTPVNLDGYWNFSAGSNFSFPVKSLKSSMKMNLNYNLTRAPSIYNNVEFVSLQNSVRFGAYLISNISPDIDFTVGSYTSFSNSTSDQVDISNNNNALVQTLSAKIDWIFWKGFFLNVDYKYRYNYVSSNPVALPHQNIINAAIGKKFLNNSLEVRISAFDLLNQYTNISTSQNDIYFQDVYSNSLTRYFAFTVKYKFNTLNGSSGLREQSGGSRRGPGGHSKRFY